MQISSIAALILPVTIQRIDPIAMEEEKETASRQRPASLQVRTEASSPFSSTPAFSSHDQRPYAWLSLIVYWTAALCVGLYGHYPHKIPEHRLVPTSLASHNKWAHALFGAALVTTLLAQIPYWRACGKRARQERDFHIGSLGLFAVANGVLETFLFLFVFDSGILLADRLEGLDSFRETLGSYGMRCFDCMDDKFYSLASFACGCSLLILYCGFIHATFWKLLVFPPHGGMSWPGQPRKGGMMLPVLAFSAMTLSWAALYFFSGGDVWGVCLLHMLADIGTGAVLRIQPPWVAGGAPLYGEGPEAVLPMTPRISRAPSITPPLAAESPRASPRGPISPSVLGESPRASPRGPITPPSFAADWKPSHRRNSSWGSDKGASLPPLPRPPAPKVQLARAPSPAILDSLLPAVEALERLGPYRPQDASVRPGKEKEKLG
eukprot:jgi/Botrbrau1/13985/Bobra.117_2s0015.1